MVSEYYERIANRGKYCPIPIAAAVGVVTVVNQIYTYNGVASVATVAKTLTADDLNEWPEPVQGEAASVNVGTVTQLAASETPTVTNSGTSYEAILDFGLPAPYAPSFQYSANGASWHGTYEVTDVYIRISVDGGATYGDAINFEGPQGIQGERGLTHRGAWSSGTTYALDDAASYDGSSWRSLQAGNLNHAPTEDAYWTILAEKGAAGAGTGDVVGPSGATANNLVAYDDSTGKLIKDIGYAIANLLLLAGRAGGQTIYGGTGAGDDLTIESTYHSTKGNICMRSTPYIDRNSVADVKNAASYSSSSNETGTMKIVMPSYGNNCMMVIRITGFNYVAGSHWEILLSSYNYNTHAWANSYVSTRGCLPFTSVRLGNDGANDLILLGTTSTTWLYPKVTVDVMAGHTGKDAMTTGWSISFVSSEGTIYNETLVPIYQFTNSIGYLGLVGVTAPTVGLALPNSATSGEGLAYAWQTHSSRRWKQNVVTIPNAIDKIKRLSGVEFDWKPENGGKHDIGLIAEDVGQVIPEIVSYEDNGIDARSVKYDHLVALLIEGIKEQQIQIDELKSEIKILKGDN